MGARLIGVIFAIGVMGLVIALFAPNAIDPIINNVSHTENMTEGETVELTDTLSLTLNDVDQGNDTVNATYRAVRTQNATSVSLNVSETKSVQLDGDTLSLTLDEIESNSDAILTAEYQPVFGWDSGPRTFVENLDIIMMILVAATAIAMSLVVIKHI